MLNSSVLASDNVLQLDAVDRNLLPDSSVTYELLDRVVYCRKSVSFPLGLRGTVIGIIGGKGYYLFVLG